MGDTIEDMRIEIEQNDNKVEILENSIRLPVSKDFEEMKKLGINKMFFTRKGDRIMDRINNLPNNHKYPKHKKQ